MSIESAKNYSLIFVDDEDIVREGISTRIDWGANGFELAGVFGDGKAALEFLETHDADVVLSDISMPRMDGLELSGILTERFPHILILLLTGFEEFEYAQEAVRHRVKEFLLKPITAEELSEVLDRTKKELDRIRASEREQERLKEQLEASFPLLRERFLYRLVSGRIDEKDLARRGGFFGWNDKGGFYLILLASLPDEWEEITRLAFAEEARNLCSAGDEVFTNRNEDVVVLFQGSNSEKLERHARKTAERLFAAAVPMGDSPVAIGLGEPVNKPEDIHRSYLGAGNAVDHTRILGLIQIQSIDDVRRKSRVSQEAFISRARILVKALRESGNYSARQALDDVFSLFEESYLTSSDAVGYLARLQYYLSDFVDEMGFGDKEEFEDLALTAEPRTFVRLSEAKRFLEEKIRQIDGHIRTRRKDAVHARIDKARSIIADRYKEKSFSLQDICAELYLSTSQFSVLFKEGTGHTFVEYLTEVRMDEAKRLLKTTDMKSYEVADSVGYQDPRYFSSIFKKTTGFTTTEYRKSLED